MTKIPWQDLVTRETVFELHKEGIRKHGGDNTVRGDAGDCIDGSLGNAWSASLYHEPEDALQGLVFAGFLLYYLANNHCFTDGNKRVAWLAGMQILLNVGLTLNADTDTAEEFMTRLVEDGNSTGEQAVEWLAERVVAVN